MSIPSVFTIANCVTRFTGELSNGEMLKFCRSYDPDVSQSHDECVINNQEDYNMFQRGCVNMVFGKFVDNNNNMVWIESKAGQIGWIEDPIEFPIGSHDNVHYVPVPHYEPPYPIIVGKENCVSQHNVTQCCPTRPGWTHQETPDIEGKCVLTNDELRQQFVDCCVNVISGTYVDPMSDSTSVDSATQESSDANTLHSTDSDSSSAKPTHTVTVTKCLVALLSMNLFLMTTSLF
ncbi:hypothetical protein IW148_000535 [Coemansia sp. RSA 1199]|nr:hypothetical protein IW148_000535 [Coemansia sp. RSA 1199]